VTDTGSTFPAFVLGWWIGGLEQYGGSRDEGVSEHCYGVGGRLLSLVVQLVQKAKNWIERVLVAGLSLRLAFGELDCLIGCIEDRDSLSLKQVIGPLGLTLVNREHDYLGIRTEHQAPDFHSVAIQQTSDILETQAGVGRYAKMGRRAVRKILYESHHRSYQVERTGGVQQFPQWAFHIDLPSKFVPWL
jgi:hypothetical protein